MNVIENILFEVLYNLQVIMSHVGCNVQERGQIRSFMLDIMFCDIII